jgi:glutamyl-tRNA synthetase
VALTGQPSTPGGAVEMAVVLGKEESMRRLAFSIDYLERATA